MAASVLRLGLIPLVALTSGCSRSTASNDLPSPTVTIPPMTTTTPPAATSAITPTPRATPSARPSAPSACACAHGCFVNGRGQLLTTKSEKLDCCWEPAAWEAQGGLSQAELMKVIADDYGGKVPTDWHVAACSVPPALRR